MLVLWMAFRLLDEETKRIVLEYLFFNYFKVIIFL